MEEIGADRWRRLRPLLDRAIDLEGDARRAYLEGLGGDDAELKHELEELLARHERQKHRTPSIAIGLVTLAFSREEEKQSAPGDRDERPHAAYAASGSGPHRGDFTESTRPWFVADNGPDNTK